ncbi:MAG: hypothetical protein HND27_04385 [Bacteroidetes bacterium]|nr:hypothetical protein [Bacteroidota bacterium]MBV6460321.1 hypothetical protein [Flavobacteriales bacterium]WKZ74688.1 MAG: hypothetical protein QY303_11120 [Vicingaceae bacterium]MCL4815813.1 hypothetical protein [Flavobacteriales bacterium]NOG94996.1 hypothetical protein [Bacteroidota bacterium]
MKQITEHSNLIFYIASSADSFKINEPIIIITHASDLHLNLLEKNSSEIKLIVDIGGNLNKIIEKIKPYNHCIIEASGIIEAVNIVKLFKSPAKKVIYFNPENEQEYKRAILKN